MPSSKLPERLQVKQFALQNSYLRASIPVAEFSRLSAMLVNTTGAVQVELQGEQDPAGHRLVRMSFEASLDVECQVCLAPYQFSARSEKLLLPVVTESQMDAAPADLEPVLMDESGLDIMTVLEDELILALPLVARHPTCAEQAPQTAGQEAVELAVEQKESPFAVLKDFKDQ